MVTNDALRAHIIKCVIKRRYPDFLRWKKPAFKESIGPCHPTVFDEFDAHVEAVLETAHETLGDLSLAELEEKFDHSGGAHSQESRLAERMLHIDSTLIRALEPVWFAGGFGVVGRESDFTYWIQMKRWSLFEAVALSIGFEPCGDIFDGVEGRSCQQDVIDFYKKRHALIAEEFNWDTPQWGGKQNVEDVCQWMRDVELEVPDELLSRAGQRFGWKPSRKTQSGAKAGSFDLRERKTMLRLIIGLAVCGYSYDPKAKRSPVPKEIRDDLDLTGLPLDLDTIRKYLREGHELLPPELFDESEKPSKKD